MVLLRRGVRLGEGHWNSRFLSVVFIFAKEKKENVFYAICETVSPVRKPEKKKGKGIFLGKKSLRTAGGCHTHRCV